MQNKCDADLTFDAVVTLGDASFFFRERYADECSGRSRLTLLLCSDVFWIAVSVTCNNLGLLFLFSHKLPVD